MPPRTPLSIPKLKPIVAEEPYPAPSRRKSSRKTAKKLDLETEPVKKEEKSMELDPREKRMAIVMKGMKEGALKTIVDKMVDSISGPVVDSIISKFKETNPAAATLAEPAVKAAFQFAFMMGMAELMDWAGPMAHKVMPNANQDNIERKSRFISIWMRKYAGERIGEELIEAVVKVFPMVMAEFSNVSVDDLELILGDDEESNTKAEFELQEMVEEKVSSD